MDFPLTLYVKKTPEFWQLSYDADSKWLEGEFWLTDNNSAERWNEPGFSILESSLTLDLVQSWIINHLII